MKVKLYTALKLKNRTASEVARLAGILKRDNSWELGKEPSYKHSKIWDEYHNQVYKLTEIKAAIAAANVGIYKDIETIAELKGEIALYQELDVKKGTEIESTGSWGDRVKIEKKYDCYLSRENIDQLIKDLQVKINEIQDRIDDYNATTEVELPD